VFGIHPYDEWLSWDYIINRYLVLGICTYYSAENTFSKLAGDKFSCIFHPTELFLNDFGGKLPLLKGPWNDRARGQRPENWKYNRIDRNLSPPALETIYNIK
jgi:hypothetical protein